MKVEVLNIDGKKTGKSVELADDIYGIEPNDHVLYLDVKGYLAAQRKGTHKSKERAEIKGSTRKIKKQKGTGTARAGSIKSPLFKGGGTVFGPRPRKYGIKLNKKVKDLAKKSALSYKVKEDKVIVVEDFNLEQPKTQAFLTILKNLEADGTKSMILVAEPNENVLLASRNIPDTAVALASGINTYEVMRAQKLIITESSLKKIEEIFKK